MHDSPPAIKLFNRKCGDSVAFAIHGQGPMLVVPAWWVSHLALDWNLPSYRRFFQQLGQHFTVVRYDRPGSGLSGRERHCFTLADEVSTLDELIDHLALDTCCLLGISCGGPPAIAYAQAHPGKVTQVVLIDSYVDGAELGGPAIQGALSALVAAHWGLGAKAILDLFDPDMTQDNRNTLSRAHKDSTSPEMAQALLMLSFQMDASAAARQLAIPALIIHRTKDRTVPFDAGRRLAALLPDAQLISVDGKAHLPWMGDNADLILQEVLRFTGHSPQTEPDPPATPHAPGHNQFLKLGDVWALSFAGTTVHVKDSRGLSDILYLIQNPGREIHALELIQPDQPLPTESPAKTLDQQAIQHYRNRLQDIAERKQTAVACSDEAQYALLEEEEDALLTTLKTETGLGGRTRAFSHTAERARKAVTARIKAAIGKIETAHRQLGSHLQASIVTGTYCCYSPAPDMHWRS